MTDTTERDRVVDLMRSSPIAMLTHVDASGERVTEALLDAPHGLGVGDVAAPGEDQQQRRALELRGSGLPYAEAAARLNTSVMGVKLRVRRALLALRAAIDDQKETGEE